jgi:hypothetical protein
MSEHGADTAGVPDDAARTWREEAALARQRLLGSLARRGVETARLEWLSHDESESLVRHWMDRGARKYQGLSLNPPSGASVRRGQFQDGTLPSWLERNPRPVFILFFRPSTGGLIARSDLEFALGNLVDLARSDGDGFAVITPDLEGVLLINVEEKLGDSALEIDAWGELICGNDR